MPKLDVKRAVSIAKSFVADLLAEEAPANIGLEEVEYDEESGHWLVTVGFSRAWNRGALGSFSGPLGRDYRVVTVDDASGSAIALKKHVLLTSDA
jgi:hypothetical protein